MTQGQSDIEYRVRNNMRQFTTFMVLFLVAQFLFTWWSSERHTIVKAVDIFDASTVGESDLCPGDKLIFTYGLDVKGSGRLLRDTTVWKVDPPRTVIYSDERRFIVDIPLSQKLTEAWIVPEEYYNYETAEFEILPPGEYRRYMSISSPLNENVLDITSTPFTIKENCNASIR